MIDLYCFPPAFQLPGPGPFAIKTEVHLKRMDLTYAKRFQGITGAPNGKLPWIDDDGKVVADSSFIRFHLEREYSLDFDGGYSGDKRALAWSIEKLVEDHLYWATVYTRWAVDENFWKGPAHFFDRLPEDVQDKARQTQRQAVFGNLHGQGFGRHTLKEVAELANVGYDALSKLLGDNNYLLGDRECGADASIFAQLASVLTPFFDGPVRDAAAKHPNLTAYTQRMMKLYFPEYVSA